MNKTLPIAIISPHGELTVPPELADRVALTEAQIFNEADAYVNEMFDFRDWVLYWEAFPYARSVIDVNRPADGAQHHRVGDGVVKRQTSYGTAVYPPDRHPSPAMEAKLIARYWQPWHEKLAHISNDPRVKLVIDVHSMAATGPGLYDDPNNVRPALEVGNLGDWLGDVEPKRGRISAPALLARRFAQVLGEQLGSVEPLVEIGALTAVNTPYCGGWNMRLHGGHQQPWLMIEINRALYIGAQTGDSPVVLLNEPRIAQIRDGIWQAIIKILAQIR